jgi:hypothetical protein
MSCGEPFVEVGFTVSYPAADVDAAARDSIGYVLTRSRRSTSRRTCRKAVECAGRAWLASV